MLPDNPEDSVTKLLPHNVINYHSYTIECECTHSDNSNSMNDCENTIHPFAVTCIYYKTTHVICSPVFIGSLSLSDEYHCLYSVRFGY